ncbi:MAG TPA: hypothetical protein ENK19_01190 [Acidobacteria bacterium]|nr:hypothetical protein [Acidobacteriota bacterium]
MPAIDRYTGMLYRTGDFGLRTLLDRGAEVVIISGGYGLVLAQEPIGWYEAVFEPAAWPNRLVERCLAAYVQSTGARNVVGILAATSSYAAVFRRTPWTAGTQVFLVSPRSPGGRIGGAMVKVPRAQGEALDELGSSGRLLPEWRSSDGLMMEVTRVQ